MMGRKIACGIIGGFLPESAIMSFLGFLIFVGFWAFGYPLMLGLAVLALARIWLRKPALSWGLVGALLGSWVTGIAALVIGAGVRNSPGTGVNNGDGWAAFFYSLNGPLFTLALGSILGACGGLWLGHITQRTSGR